MQFTTRRRRTDGSGSKPPALENSPAIAEAVRKDQKADPANIAAFSRILKAHSLEFDDTDSAREDKTWAEESYAAFSTAAKSMNYSAKDVEEFAKGMVKTLNAIDAADADGYPAYEEGVKTGLLISALVNCCQENEFDLDLSGLNTTIKYLAWENEAKTVRIICRDCGNEGGLEDVATEMKSGNVYVNADVLGAIGYGKKGGRLEFDGEGFDIGPYHEGGTLLVKQQQSNVIIGEYGKGGLIVLTKGIAPVDLSIDPTGSNSVADSADGVEIMIYGDVHADQGVASSMESGTVVIFGDVYGNVGPGANLREEPMVGGDVYIRGNVHGKVAAFSGTVAIDGSYGEVEFEEYATVRFIVNEKVVFDGPAIAEENARIEGLEAVAFHNVDLKKRLDAVSEIAASNSNKKVESLVSLAEHCYDEPIALAAREALNQLAMSGQISDNDVLLNLIEYQCEADNGIRPDPNQKLDYGALVSKMDKETLGKALEIAKNNLDIFQAGDEEPQVRNLITLIENRLRQP